MLAERERDVRVHIYIIPSTPRYIYIREDHLPLLVHQQNTPAIYIVPGHIYISLYPLPPLLPIPAQGNRQYSMPARYP